MVLHSAPSDSLIDVLDRVLDKSITIESWVRSSLAGISTTGINPAELRVVSAQVFHGYGRFAAADELNNFFPYWRRDLWTK